MRRKFCERYNQIWEKEKSCMGCERVCDVSLSNADTFIEYCFEQSCTRTKNGLNVLTEWRYHKDQYCKIIATTIYDFQHYSRHDESHSISILESIEMVLGDERIVSLSRGDLWLLLEAAYSHDLGMAVTGEELFEIWRNEEFKEFLLMGVSSYGMDIKEAASYYKQMDNLLDRKRQMDDLDEKHVIQVQFDECWPMHIVNYVDWLVADYIRRRHSQRQEQTRARVVVLQEPAIPKRLYQQVIEITKLHTDYDYENILNKLKQEEKGIGAEHIHPRFAAAMLRLGDVLDMENDRFSLYAMTHMERIPSASLLHFGKHNAISDIQISMQEIRLEAVSNDLQVCNNASQWFQMIDQEVNDLICHWNDIVPDMLKGCRLIRSKCQVFYKNLLGQVGIYTVSNQKYFEINRYKILELLVGANIYDMRIDFIREYLQNAMDATKMQLWQNIKLGLYEEYIDSQLLKNKKLMPFHLPRNVYENSQVKLRVEMPANRFDVVVVSIEDQGIGMEKECLRVISSPGSGWKKRERYNRQIREMPSWLRPTGGFGIGIQSAFMAAKKVLVETQTDDESMGRRITMESPTEGGIISIEDFVLGHHGTKVKVEVPVELFQSWNSMIKKSYEGEIRFNPVSVQTDKVDMFNALEIENYVIKVLKEYLRKIIPNPLIPIEIYSRGKKVESIESTRWKEQVWNDFGEEKFTIFWKGAEYRFSIYNRNSIAIWDRKNGAYVSISWTNGKRAMRPSNIVCYKNVRMTKERVLRGALRQWFDIYIDYMGFQAEKVLKIHRNEFAEEFDASRRTMDYLRIYFHICSYLEKNVYILPSERLPEFFMDRDFILARMMFVEEDDEVAFRERIKELCDADAGKINWVIPCHKVKIELKPGSLADEVSDILELPIEEEKYHIALNNENVTLLELYDRLLPTLRDCHTKKNNNHVLLVETKDTDGEHSSVKHSGFLEWVSRNMVCLGGELRFKENVSQGDWQYQIIKEGLLESEFLECLSVALEVEKARYVLGGLNDPWGKNFYRFGMNEYRKEFIVLTENEFYSQSFKGPDGRKDRKIFDAQVMQSWYRDLLIDSVPYDLSDSGMDPFLISPISENIRVIARNNNFVAKTQGNYLGIDAFITVVMGKDEDHPNEEFGYLMNWVTQHAINPDIRGNKNAVWNLYKAYTLEIYERIVKKGLC